MFFKSFRKTVSASLCAAAVFTIAFTAKVHAQSLVTVSVPELHSLVSQLLAGVDHPHLLFAKTEQRLAPLPPASSRATFEAAKMVVWVGPQYETALAGQRLIDPALSLKGLTLSATLPLLGLPDADHPDRSAGTADMRFWLDPRLAKIAVGRIAPNLTRLYPGDAETILENEIRLKQRLKKLEQDFRHALNTPDGVPLHVPQSDVLYLAWRFHLKNPACPAAAAKLGTFQAAPGQDYYFQLMDAVLSELKACEARRA